MARAKRTDRAEARRSYRQRQVELAAEDDEPTPSPTGSHRPASRGTPKSAPRPGVLGAIRLSATPPDIRGDIAALPELAVRSKGIWLPILIVVVSGGALLLPGMGQNAIALLAFQAFVVPPPMAASFLSGLMAPRGAWLGGGIVGVAAALMFTLVALLYVAPTSGASTATLPDQRASYVAFAWVVSPTMGTLVGAFAGFYRRFLRLASPQPDRSRDRRRSSNRR